MPKDRTDHANHKFDAASIAHYLDLIAHDLEVSPRDGAEGLYQYAERLISAVQDTCFSLVDELDQLERDLENVIDHIDDEQAT